jgi:plasmid maintenance system killer protein
MYTGDKIMEIRFTGDKERRFYQSEKQLVKAYGKPLADKITRRIKEMESFDSVGQLLDSKLGKGHLLDHDYKGCFSVHLNGNYRLISKLIYDNDSDLSKLNFYKIEIVQIIEVKDYHE